jgi:hypothetical protein
MFNWSIECNSYSDEDGYTKDTYKVEIQSNTGSVKISHDILCGLMGKALFSVPCIDKNYGVPIPDYMVQLMRMMIETNDLKTEPRYQAASLENFIQWFDCAMEQIAKEKKEANDLLQKAKSENEELEKELEEEHATHMRWMSTNNNLLKSFLNR